MALPDQSSLRLVSSYLARAPSLIIKYTVIFDGLSVWSTLNLLLTPMISQWTQVFLIQRVR